MLGHLAFSILLRAMAIPTPVGSGNVLYRTIYIATQHKLCDAQNNTALDEAARYKRLRASASGFDPIFAGRAESFFVREDEIDIIRKKRDGDGGNPR
jgi:hypothetical protein